MKFAQTLKKSGWEIAGIFLCGVGVSFALTFVGLGFSEEILTNQKHRVAESVKEMKSALATAKVPDDQITGLIRIHKAALASQAAQEHFLALAFFILLSLLVAAFGFTVILWARFRTFVQTQSVTGKQPADVSLEG